jgi:hypothetical protein
MEEILAQAIGVLGDGWNLHNRRAVAQQTVYLKCLACCRALMIEEALATMSECDSLDHRRSNFDRPSEFMAVGYASTALAAGKVVAADPTKREWFDRSYLAAYRFMADPWHDKEMTRFILSAADAYVGACDRAWVRAINIPAPATRADAIATVMQHQLKTGPLAPIRKMAAMLPSDPPAPVAMRWLGEAVALLEARPDQWQEWVEGLRSPAGRACGMAGIAAGAARRTREKVIPLGPRPKTADTSSPPTKPESQTPAWWLARALKRTESVELPRARALLSAQIASVCAAAGKKDLCRNALQQATQSVLEMWNDVASKRRTRPTYKDGVEWDTDWRSEKAFVAGVEAILDVLWEIEAVQRRADDKQGAYQTLLLALTSAELLPRNTSSLRGAKLDSPEAWLARIAGRMRVLDRVEAAEQMLDAAHLALGRDYSAGSDFLKGLAAAESGDLEALQGHAQVVRNGADPRDSQSTALQYALVAYGRLAILAAERQDRAAFRQAMLSLNGLLGESRHAARLYAAQGAALFGDGESMEENLRATGQRGPEADAVRVVYVRKLAAQTLTEGAKKAANRIDDPVARALAKLWITRAQVGKEKQDPVAFWKLADAELEDVDKAAVLAGVGAALAGVK